MDIPVIDKKYEITNTVLRPILSLNAPNKKAEHPPTNTNNPYVRPHRFLRSQYKLNSVTILLKPNYVLNPN